ncbi:TPA: hypothetical protein ACKP5Q_000519 [Serratia marcescens]|uniref:hypothetical protein n=1 Tax=Serratia sp. Nf2 TaxID=2116540 RepID=UPI000D17499B|nr:hypothetical protein [Serratia sp. Nf2]PTA75784.1 hypothetical protein C9411_18585 [Serratia sp. Nf2]
MDNKLSELSKPEQFDAEVEIHGGEPFAVWAPAVNGSHVKKEQYFALLAELEATRKQSQELARQCGRLGARAAIAERKLATPVRLSCETHPRCRTQHAKDVRAAGFKVMGDEQC